MPILVEGSENLEQMDRTLEPEIMDTIEEAEAYDAMDFLSVNTAFVERLIELGAEQGHYLDLGTGPARIPILLAQQKLEIEITAVDLSAQMLVVARRRVAEVELSARIHLRQADAKNLPFPDQHFDGIFSNSIIHHIPEPIEVIHEVWRVLQPKGLIFLRDLRRLDSATDIEAIVEQYAANDTEYQRKMFRDSLFAALTVKEVEKMIQAVGLDAIVIRSSDRHWSIEPSI